MSSLNPSKHRHKWRSRPWGRFTCKCGRRREGYTPGSWGAEVQRLSEQVEALFSKHMKAIEAAMRATYADLARKAMGQEP